MSNTSVIPRSKKSVIGKLAGVHTWGRTPDPEVVAQLRSDLAAIRIADEIKAACEYAKPSPEQVRELVAMLKTAASA